ncbi:MAG TPA: CapA family protein [Vitreimonas sp.]|nr:CapA family protein [Vitreimonas sp.]
MKFQFWLIGIAGLIVVLGLLSVSWRFYDSQPIPLDFSALAPVASLTPIVPETFAPQPPSLAQLLDNDVTWTTTLSAERVTTLLTTGDVLTARSVNARTVRDQDFTWPFVKTADKLQQADITYINLETPLVSACPVTVTGMIFCGDFRNIEGLLFAGVDVVNLANNHAGNHDAEGVEETVAELEKNNLLVSGVHGPVYLTKEGRTFAFLGYNEVDIQPGINLAKDELIQQEIKAARQQADIVIVQFHWGIEYTHQPSSNQKRLARLAIDEGADIIIGNHPHWFQPVEFYKGKLITYSHGNFVFDQMWSEETRTGIVGKYHFYDHHLIDAEFLPVYIEEYGQPRWLEGSHKEAVLDKLRQESQRLSD